MKKEYLDMKRQQEFDYIKLKTEMNQTVAIYEMQIFRAENEYLAEMAYIKKDYRK
jgi:hypothetical protein